MTTLGDSVDFTPDESVHVHAAGAIQWICAPFKSHEAGLPEWFKNSSDVYLRLNVPPELCTILLLLRDGTAGRPSAVGCLDFGGMTTEDIERRFRHWADPEAAGQADVSSVEGGHGNGGKCYMTQMFESHAYLHTLRDGRASRYGFKSGDYKPGYFPSAEKGRGYPVKDARAELNKALEPFGITVQKLPVEAQQAFAARKSFTLAVGFAAKGFPRRIPASQWIEQLEGHQQMAQAIQLNLIRTVHNGMLLPAPLRLPQITPIAGAEAPRVVPVPAKLKDPNSLSCRIATREWVDD